MILKPENREEWLAMRQEQGIGGSDSGAILGFNPWQTNLQLWRYKTGLEVPPDLSDNPSVIFGKKAEEHIRELFVLDYPHFDCDYHEFFMYVNDKLPWQFATLDGELTDKESGERGILEIKTTTIQNKSQWDEWENGIPQRYYAQVLHQLSATGWNFAILRAYIRHYKGGEFRATVRDYRIDRKDVQEDIEYLCEKESQFMECVRNRKPPAAIITM
jgi:putative phage-type endonuclease